MNAETAVAPAYEAVAKGSLAAMASMALNGAMASPNPRSVVSNLPEWAPPPVEEPTEHLSSEDLRTATTATAAAPYTATELRSLSFCAGLAFAIQPGRELGQVYCRIVELLQEGRWKAHRSVRPNSQLILAGAQAGKLDWRRLGFGAGCVPLVNYYRGFERLTQKVPMVQSLRHYAEETGLKISQFLPASYLFFPAKPELSEFQLLAEDHERRRQVCGERGCWILKSSNGAKGEGIVISEDIEHVLNFLQSKPSTAGPWVAQEYLERPLLLSGGRKFDIRSWVFLAHDFRIYLFSDSVVRTCSVPWSLDNLGDRFSHLSNHCVQEQCEAYGSHESPINLINFKRFAQMFDEGQLQIRSGTGFSAAVPPKCFNELIFPQIEEMIRDTLLALRETLELPENSRYSSMQAFGYDFMIDADFTVKLLEVNATPALSEDLLEEFVRDMKVVGIERYMAEQNGNPDLAAAIVEEHQSPQPGRNTLYQIYP